MGIQSEGQVEDFESTTASSKKLEAKGQSDVWGKKGVEEKVRRASIKH